MGEGRDSPGPGAGQPQDGRDEGVAGGVDGPAPIRRLTVGRRGGAQRIPRPPTIRLGEAAPWASLPPEAVRLPLDEVRRRCRTFPVPAPPPRVPGTQAAAVLVPLFEAGGETRVVLTRRPDTMPSHRGDVAF